MVIDALDLAAFLPPDTACATPTPTPTPFDSVICSLAAIVLDPVLARLLPLFSHPAPPLNSVALPAFVGRLPATVVFSDAALLSLSYPNAFMSSSVTSLGSPTFTFLLRPAFTNSVILHEDASLLEPEPHYESGAGEDYDTHVDEFDRNKTVLLSLTALSGAAVPFRYA
jgi:hypothetical protein